MKEGIVDGLRKLGLTEYEAKAYATLGGCGRSDRPRGAWTIRRSQDQNLWHLAGPGRLKDSWSLCRARPPTTGRWSRIVWWSGCGDDLVASHRPFHQRVEEPKPGSARHIPRLVHQGANGASRTGWKDFLGKVEEELSELIATEFTLLLWPVNVLISYPLSKFHILMVLSELPETIYLLSELIDTEVTKSLWPFNVLICLSTF